MQDFPVCRLLDEDCLSILVLVAAVDIVIERKLCGRRGFLCLCRLFYGYMLPLLFPLIFQQVEVHLVQPLVDGMRNDGFGLLKLPVHLEQVDLDLVVRHVAHQHQTLGHVELLKDLSIGLEQSRLSALQRRLLIVHLSGAVVPNSISLGNHKVFPAFLEGRIAYFFDLDLILIEGMPKFEVDRVDDPREAHHPIGHAREVLDEMQVVLELVVGGTRCVKVSIRGIVRNREVIIVE